LLGGEAAASRAPAMPRPEAIVQPAAPASADGVGELKFREAKEKFVAQWERDFIVGALRASGGNISRAAERAGMYRQSFQQKMRELGVSVAELGLKSEDE